jgi:hypothetical protein
MLNADRFRYSAFSAFPDSFQFDQGSQNHSFRIREELKDLANERRPPSVDGLSMALPILRSGGIPRRSEATPRYDLIPLA